MEFSENPFDFVSQFRKLQEEQKRKKILSTISTNAKKDETTSTNAPSKKIDSINNYSNLDVVPSTSNNNSKTVPTTTQCVASRTRKKRGTVTVVEGPVICIGDFDDGYNIPPPKAPREITLDDDDDDVIINEKKDEEDIPMDVLNRIVNVKVYWRKSQTHRFPLRMFQSLESIFEHFAKLEDIKTSHVRLELHNKPVLPSDTPHSINYKIYDFIDGDIEFYKSIAERAAEEKEKDEEPTDNDDDDDVEFSIRQKDVKRPILMSMKKSDKMIILYIKLSEKLGFDINSFTLEFDGDKIKKTDTIESLDLEGGECFELFQKSKK
ncbi:uncharacterized protein CG4449 [Adelges cooleyi]|uniref:uncharacterized protein CG4449 n=1 Tax=Adelges cooleyi TaxID=133065 RepID=UPI00217FA7B4|nr:uncharacterized protein CG4449 [Adelges cooleyi]